MKTSVHIINGFHNFVEPPKEFEKDAFLRRAAVVFIPDTICSNPSEEWLSVFPAFVSIIKRTICLFNANSIEILHYGKVFDSIGKYEEYILSLPKDDDDISIEPPRQIRFVSQNSSVCVMEAEYWAYYGGPPPYSDSFTISFYAYDGAIDGIVSICESVFQQESIKVMSNIFTSQTYLNCQPVPVVHTVIRNVMNRIRRTKNNLKNSLEKNNFKL